MILGPSLIDTKSEEDRDQEQTAQDKGLFQKGKVTKFVLNKPFTKMDERLKAFERLLNIMDDLREKCPWDRRQTMESLRPLTIEEVYELGDAILDEDLGEVKKELGDIILHMIFYAKIGQEKGAFDISEVLNQECEKLVRRHPHIYANTSVSSTDEVKKNWERIKLEEGKRSVLEGIPRSLPAMVKALRIQEKVKGVGFEWERTEQVKEKVEEELGELEAEVKEKGENKSAELGDVLFAMINYARAIDVDPEEALERTNKRFMDRFQDLEEKAEKNGQDLKDLSLEKMEAYWEETKDSGK